MKQYTISGSLFIIKTVPYLDAMEIGYTIYDNKNHSKGYTTEALALFVEYIFKVKLISRLEIRILPSHISSEKFALKCGFQFERTMRKTIFNHGYYQDLKQISLLREDLKN